MSEFRGLPANLRRAGWIKLPRVGASGSMRRTRIVSLGSKLILAAGMDPDMELCAMWLPVQKDGEILITLKPFDDVLKLSKHDPDIDGEELEGEPKN